MTSSWLDDAENALDVEQQHQEAIEDAKKWDPDDGDLIKGKLMDVKYINTKYGWTHLLIILDSDDQAWEVWAGRKMLKNQLIDQVPALGKGIAIRYHGMKEGKEFKYHDYTLSSEPQTEDEKKASHLFYHGLLTADDAQDVEDNRAKFNGSANDGELSAPF